MHIFTMIGLLEFKKALGDKAKELTEEEILKLREDQDQMADVFFSICVNQVKKEKIKL